jgi:hypothetical protein
MNTKQSIYNILASAKKEPVKVELGYIEDTRALLDKADQIFRQATGQAMKASEAFDEAEQAYQLAAKKVAEMEQFVKDAAERGFPQENLKPTIQKMKQEAEGSVKKSQRYSQTAQSITTF